MTKPQLHDFWQVSFPVKSITVPGASHYEELIARDEREARLMAKDRSRSHGSAVITNRAGLVASYRNGEELITKHEAEGLVECDDHECTALKNPKSLEEFKIALEHWQEHNFLSGCSHGQ